MGAAGDACKYLQLSRLHLPLRKSLQSWLDLPSLEPDVLELSLLALTLRWPEDGDDDDLRLLEPPLD